MPPGAAHSSPWDTMVPHQAGTWWGCRDRVLPAPTVPQDSVPGAGGPQPPRPAGASPPRDSPALKPCRGWRQHRCWKRWLLNSERDEKQPETHLTGDCRAKPAVLRLASPGLLHQSPSSPGSAFLKLRCLPQSLAAPSSEVRLQQRWKNQPWLIKMLGCFLPEPGCAPSARRALLGANSSCTPAPRGGPAAIPGVVQGNHEVPGVIVASTATQTGENSLSKMFQAKPEVYLGTEHSLSHPLTTFSSQLPAEPGSSPRSRHEGTCGQCEVTPC